MRVLVTGGTGFVGSHTAIALGAAGHEVRLLVRSPAKAERLYAERGVDLPELVEGDLADAAAVDRALSGAEGVVHAAAVVAMEAGRAREVLETNARGVESVVGGAHRRGIRSIVYVSSVGALFRPGGPPVDDRSEVVAGRTAYARSKADAEVGVRKLQEAGAPIRTTYPTAVIGPDDPGLSEANHAVRTFLRALMVMTSSGFQAVDVRDVAEVHCRLIEADTGPGRFVVGGHYQPWRELAEMLDELTGRRVRRLKAPGALLRGAGVAGDWVKRVVPFDFPLTGEGMSFATRWTAADSRATLDALGLKFRNPRETYADTVRWLHRAGHLTQAEAGRLAQPR